MTCPQCKGIEETFDNGLAADELKTYRKNGPAHQTRLMLDVLRQAGVSGLTLLDIGGGVGAVQHELFKAGIQSAVDVDASSAYLAAAREEAARQGHADQTQYLHGNFVDLAPQVAQADIVTLDRVICCYPDMHALVNLSSARAKRFFALVYPRESWWMKLGRFGINLPYQLRRSPFRFFVHPSEQVDAIVRANGLQSTFRKNAGLIWQVAIYARP